MSCGSPGLYYNRDHPQEISLISLSFTSRLVGAPFLLFEYYLLSFRAEIII